MVNSFKRQKEQFSKKEVSPLTATSVDNFLDCCEENTPVQKGMCLY